MGNIDEVKNTMKKMDLEKYEDYIKEGGKGNELYTSMKSQKGLSL